MKNVRINVADGPAMLFYNSKNVVVDGFQYDSEARPVIRVTGEQSSKLEFRNTRLSEEDIDRASEISRGAVTILHSRE
jgi:hypothetical protein